ncbi:MAG: response regulator transcription factor [Candidatus Aminicenantes bacterium]|nr:response regulator transcription factor [Candidatus Aminicenantes bacterium]
MLSNKIEWTQGPLFIPVEKERSEGSLIKVFLADPHAMVREGTRRILENNDAFVVIGEAENNFEVLEKLATADCDIVILEISLSNGKGLQVLQELKKNRPELPVLVLSLYPEGYHAVRAIRAGADGFVTKERTTDELLKAIQIVCSGKRYISPSFAEKLTFEMGSAVKNPLHEILSDREFQVMFSIASGKTMKIIAEELSLNIHTISTYRSRMLSKMGMKNDAEVIYYAVKEGLVD